MPGSRTGLQKLEKVDIPLKRFGDLRLLEGHGLDENHAAEWEGAI
jgi:hypothetical protein